jgi:hypothetical protein
LYIHLHDVRQQQQRRQQQIIAAAAAAWGGSAGAVAIGVAMQQRAFAVLQFVLAGVPFAITLLQLMQLPAGLLCWLRCAATAAAAAANYYISAAQQQQSLQVLRRNHSKRK